MLDITTIQFLWKDRGSANGECPSLFKVNGGYIGVGKALTAEEAAQVRALGASHGSGIAADEVAVFFPANVLDRLNPNG
ncbi:hypothetical protein ACQP2Y_21350 [Actinoplanes sp. CA-051413]|uniref:hypothetical protein n=1 Tax=Actinoplanes sp. CA-051413 TaxID=3239899 RepID=UPI003D957298